MIELDRTHRITVCGLPGTGKTMLTRHLCHLAEPNLLIYDPLAQYRMFKPECVYTPKSDSAAEFNQVCKQLCGQKNVLFVVEEAERYLGQGKPMGDYAFDLINRGRNWGVGVYAVTRRIQRISKDFFDLCSHIIFFRNGAKSKEYIRDIIGRDIMQWVYSLERYHFIDYDLETEEAIDGTLEIEGVRQHIETHEVEAVEIRKEAKIIKKEEQTTWQKEGQAGAMPLRQTTT